MDAKERRKNIISILKKKEGPIKGTELAKRFNVSRQVIVQDIAILRAKGEKILATPQGYMVINNKSEEFNKTIVCKHTSYDEIEDELKTIIDMGGKVIDVIVEHPIYGEIKSPLMIGSRIDIEEFMKELRAHQAEPLATLNDGVHLHTIKVPSEEVFNKIEKKLEYKGYLISNR
jgi:hypothetical protein